MIDFQGLAKSYGAFQALAPLSLAVNKGECSASSVPTALARRPPPCTSATIKTAEASGMLSGPGARRRVGRLVTYACDPNRPLGYA
jgi:hypothetical protein